MIRIDDIPQQVADDIHAFGVIGMRDCGKFLNYFAKYDIINSPINKNLTEVMYA